MRCVLPVLISIHALLAESDPTTCTSPRSGHVFLSTLSLRRATGMALFIAIPTPYFYPRSPCGERPRVVLYIRVSTDISIHALLAESDGWPSRPSCGPCGYFYPRSPCGERQEHTLACPAGCLFLSTLSLRRATATFNIDAFALYISIHALLAESDIGRA